MGVVLNTSAGAAVVVSVLDGDGCSGSRLLVSASVITSSPATVMAQTTLTHLRLSSMVAMQMLVCGCVIEYARIYKLQGVYLIAATALVSHTVREKRPQEHMR